MTSKEWNHGARQWAVMGGVIFLAALLLNSALMLVPAVISLTFAIVGFGYGWDEAKREREELHDLFGHD